MVVLSWKWGKLKKINATQYFHFFFSFFFSSFQLNWSISRTENGGTWNVLLLLQSKMKMKIFFLLIVFLLRKYFYFLLCAFLQRMKSIVFYSTPIPPTFICIILLNSSLYCLLALSCAPSSILLVWFCMIWVCVYVYLMYNKKILEFDS